MSLIHNNDPFKMPCGCLATICTAGLFGSIHMLVLIEITGIQTKVHLSQIHSELWWSQLEPFQSTFNQKNWCIKYWKQIIFMIYFVFESTYIRWKNEYVDIRLKSRQKIVLSKSQLNKYCTYIIGRFFFIRSKILNLILKPVEPWALDS